MNARAWGEAGEEPTGEWMRSEALDLADAARQRMYEARRGRRVRRLIEEYREAGIEKMAHDALGYARGRPVTAMLIAAGAGLALGWLSTAVRRWAG